jgi:hypothetical protein
VGDGHALVGRGDELLEQLVQPEAVQEVIDEGKWSQAMREQRQW